MKLNCMKCRNMHQGSDQQQREKGLTTPTGCILRIILPSGRMSTTHILTRSPGCESSLFLEGQRYSLVGSRGWVVDVVSATRGATTISGGWIDGQCRVPLIAANLELIVISTVSLAVRNVFCR